MNYILALYNVIFKNDEGDKRQTFVIARKAMLVKNRITIIHRSV